MIIGVEDAGAPISMNIAPPASRLTAVSAALLLHVALIAAVLPHLAFLNKELTPPKPVKIELLHEPPTPPAPLPVVPPMPPQPLPQKQPHPKPQPAPQPVPEAREAAVPQIKSPEASFDAKPVPSNSTAVAAAPAAPAPAPAKTGVSIPASYAASNRKPPYPRLSRQNEEQGTVELRILVKADGSAGAVEIASSSGYPLLDESARSTVQTWRFNPATVDGKAVAEWYRVSIPFKLQN